MQDTMFRLATIIVWLNFSRSLLWNAGTTAEGEWLVWAGDWLKCGGRFHVAASWN
jgi:hypothetical protein